MTMARRPFRTIAPDSDEIELIAALVAPAAAASARPPEASHSLREIPPPDRSFSSADIYRVPGRAVGSVPGPGPPLPSFTKLSPHPTCRDRHDNRLNHPDFLVGDPLVSGYARVFLHSGVAPQRHGGRQVQHQGRPLIEHFVVTCRIVKIYKRLALSFWQHRSSSRKSPRSFTCGLGGASPTPFPPIRRPAMASDLSVTGAGQV